MDYIFRHFRLKQRNSRLITGFLGLIIFQVSLSAQELKTITKLPRIVKETSGIEASREDQVWTFNDSGGEPELYLCDTTGRLLRTLKITNARNKDWEDITQDDQGNFYIGDFGNNGNGRKDLTIYKIPNPQQIKKDFVQAERISFSFEDQHSFPPPTDSLNFDCESILWKDGSLYLFSKHRTFPMATKLYRIPDKPGSYIAQKIGSFQTSSEEETNLYAYWITAADISPDGTKIALISSEKLWIFSDFEGDHFFKGKLKVIDFPDGSQKEALVFVTNNRIYITDEQWFGGIGRNLYVIDIE